MSGKLELWVSYQYKNDDVQASKTKNIPIPILVKSKNLLISMKSIAGQQLEVPLQGTP